MSSFHEPPKALFQGGDPHQRWIVVADRETLQTVDRHECVDNLAAHRALDFLERSLPANRIAWLTRTRPRLPGDGPRLPGDE